MGTRSTISVINNDENGKKTVRTIYCHWDGYISHNGVILVDNYDTSEKANALVDLGNLSALAPKLSGSPFHSFENAEDGVCIAYGRDRGETDQKATKNVWVSPDQINGQSYDYFFIDGEWYFNTYKGLQLVKEDEEYLAAKGKYDNEESED